MANQQKKRQGSVNAVDGRAPCISTTTSPVLYYVLACRLPERAIEAGEQISGKAKPLEKANTSITSSSEKKKLHSYLESSGLYS